MGMFGIVTNTLGRGRKCELVHEVKKDSRGHSAAPASLIIRVSCGTHFMTFNLNVIIFIE